MIYYETDLGKIILDDCLNYLQTDIKIDIIITDPPYGVGKNYKVFDDTFANWAKLMLQWLPLAIEKAKAVIFTPGGLEQEIFLLKNFNPPKWRLCWYKGAQAQRIPIGGFKYWETVFVYGNLNITPKQYSGDYFFVDPGTENLKKINHPCPKPKKFFEHLITKYTNEDDIICDTFLGSGQFAKVCEYLERKWIGIELNPAYCKIAKDGLRSYKVWNSLFKSKFF